MARTFVSKYRKAAYGPAFSRKEKGVGKVMDVGSGIGIRVIQYVYLRPPVYGYRLVRKKR